MLEGVARGGELLWVEGQGSLLHPAYSGVTLGLIHGSAPHAFVLCHMPASAFVDDDERFPMPSLAELVELHERIALLARPAKVVAIALNTRALDEDARARRDRRGRGRNGPAGRRRRAVRRRAARGAVLEAAFANRLKPACNCVRTGRGSGGTRERRDAEARDGAGVPGV